MGRAPEDAELERGGERLLKENSVYRVAMKIVRVPDEKSLQTGKVGICKCVCLRGATIGMEFTDFSRGNAGEEER